MFTQRAFILLIFIFSSTGPAAASFYRDFTTTTSSNVYVAVDRESIHFKCDGSLEDNSQALVSLPPVPATGATASFYLDVRAVSGASVKLQLFQDVTLEWKEGRANWVFYKMSTGAPITLSASNIKPNTGVHSVTYVRGKDSFLVFEDGRLAAAYRSPRTEVTPAFGMTMLKEGDKVDLTLSNIQIHYGVASRSAILTT